MASRRTAFVARARARRQGCAVRGDSSERLRHRLTRRYAAHTPPPPRARRAPHIAAPARRVNPVPGFESPREPGPPRLPPPRLVRVPSPLGRPEPHVRRRPGGTQRRNAGQTLRRRAESSKTSPESGRRGDPGGPQQTEVCAICAHSPEDRADPTAGTPANNDMGDAGLEPATSALSRRRSPS